MNVLDSIPRADFLALIKRNPSSFLEHRSQGQMPLWHEAGKAPKSQNRPLVTCVYDALVFRTAWAIVSQGTTWPALALALPGLQLTLRDGLDRAETFAIVTVIDERQFVVGCGTAEELAAAGVIGPPRQMFAMSIPIVVQHLRRRAAEHDITIPRKLAPPPAAMPAWVEKEAVYGSTRHGGGVKVAWSPDEQFTVALLN
jgi:hypothetical protein